ncbi:MAG: CHASE domain-containing protein, partial [bacterium]|nr:CHASE domain-containing protein [bacterium]
MSTKPAADLWRSWPAFMAVVVGYFLLAWIAGWTRIPAGFVVPLFPAAGLALVATVRGGSRLLAAVAVGALAFNLNLQLSLAPWPVAVGLACAVTVGSTLQAFLGAVLVRRLLGDRVVVDPFAAMLPILIAGGLVACLVAAFLSTLAFFIFGGLPAAGVGRFFLTWWTGDAAGVMVCSPFLLAFCGVTIRDFRERLLNLVLPLAMTMAIVLVAFDAIRTFRQEEFSSAFAARSDRDGGYLQRAVDLHMEVLRGLARSIGNARPLTAEDFRRLVADPLARYPGLQALSWNPVVRTGDRQAHVAAMRSSGLPDYRIVAREDGALVDAPIAPRYVVVAFIEPYAENRAAQGFDIHSNAVRRSSIEISEMSGLPVTTGRITLAQEQESQFGVLVLAPVLEADGSLQGFVAAVLRLGTLLQEVIGPHADPGLRYVLVDEGAPADALLAVFGADLGLPDVEVLG